MDAKNSRTEAEKYRQERKERIKRDAKRTSKGTGKVSNLIAKIIGWVIVAALVVGFCWFIADFFGWGPKLTTVATVKVGDKVEKIKETEFNYYYTKVFESTAQTQSVYSQYGLTGSYDFTQPPDAQTTKDDEDNEITYAEYFKNKAIETIEQIHYYAAKARELGLSISEEDQKSISEEIKRISTQTDERTGTKFSPGYVLVSTYGKGINLSLYKKYLNESYLSKAYTDNLTENYIKSVTDEEVGKKFDESPELYEKVDLRIYGFKIESDSTDENGNTVPAVKTAEAQKAKALEMISKITDEDSFLSVVKEYCEPEEIEEFSDPNNSIVRGMTYETIQSNMSEEDAKWAFSSDRNPGDVSVWSTTSYVYAVLLVNTAYKDTVSPATVRHILVQFPEEEADDSVAEDVVIENTTSAADEEGVTAASEEGVADTTVPETHYDDGIAYLGAKHSSSEEETVYKKTPATKEEAKEIAESYLALYKAGEQTEESFAKLADLYSDDTASTSAGNGSGGLYEDITVGKMVKPFEDWAFDPERKPGDVDIVETTYGYHIMYFVKRSEYESWEKTVREAIAADKAEADQSTLEEAYKDSFTETSSMSRALKRIISHVTDLSSRYNASHSS
ncbi:MAG: peptidylprolyl isomerase [Clostridia bacterium]|nr:peptidylprolyl isomerase [Clostridia bacterium]